MVEGDEGGPRSKWESGGDGWVDTKVSSRHESLLQLTV